MTRPCAEHEALLTEALERVKRLEAALRAIERVSMETRDAMDLRLDDIYVLATKALRPEGT